MKLLLGITAAFVAVCIVLAVQLSEASSVPQDPVSDYRASVRAQEIEAVAKKHPGYAGIWIDGGEVFVATTSRDFDIEGANVVRVEFDLATLRSIQKTVVDRVIAEGIDGYAVGVDVRKNKVTVVAPDRVDLSGLPGKAIVVERGRVGWPPLAPEGTAAPTTTEVGG